MKTKILTLFLMIGFLLCFSHAEARQNLSSEVLTGGGTNPWALDRFVTGGSGQDDSCSAPSCSYAALADGDSTLVFDYANGRIYNYVLDIDSAATESSPEIIAPDYTECVGACTGYVGDARWLLVSIMHNAIVLDDADITADDISAFQAKGMVIITNDGKGAPSDYDIPAGFKGMRVYAFAEEAQVMTLDLADANDIIHLIDGTTLAAGNAIDSDGSAGSSILLVCHDGDGGTAVSHWYVHSQVGVWIDGGVD